MYELAGRANIVTAYPDLLRTSARSLCRFATLPSFILNGPPTNIDLPALNRYVDNFASWVGPSGAMSGLSGALRTPDRLDELRNVRKSIIAVAVPQHFDKLSRFESILKRLCVRGNGVFLSGAYWLQYFASDGPPQSGLREKLEITHNDMTLGERKLDSGAYNVGVHLRLADDYKNWHGGSYHFSIEDYAEVMRSIGRARPDAVIHLFSDRNVLRSYFPTDLNVDCQPNATVDNDFVNLGRCNVVVGPPSTFATWSSFLGSRRRIVLTQSLISEIKRGANVFDLQVRVDRPTFSYAPGVDGPL